MGWANCGENSTTGEQMGYAHVGICHDPDCPEKIDHGLSYVCGGDHYQGAGGRRAFASMHEGGEHGCGYYFCTEHLKWPQLCKECVIFYEAEFPED